MDSKLTINISEEELKVMNNADFFYYKHSVTKKIYKIFANLKQEVRLSEIHKHFPYPESTDISTGKISKGENYNQLPYIILDYPRLFSSDDIFAFRSMFLWGNYFLFTLHLAGASKDKFAPFLLKNMDALKDKDIYFYIYDDQWEHTLEPEHYTLLQDMKNEDVKKKIVDQPFIKMAKKLPFNQWIEVISVGKTAYEIFFKNMMA